MEYIKSVKSVESVGESNLKQQRLSPTYVRVRRNLPQIAQRTRILGYIKSVKSVESMGE